MTLPSLQHLVRAAQALADDRTILVLGSASLLATHPSLGQLPAETLPRPLAHLRSMVP